MNPVARALASTCLGLCLLASAAAPADAVPMAMSQNLSFASGTQSLWGPGGSSASFGASGSAGIPGSFFTPAIGAGYALSASAGSVSGSLLGSLSAHYDDRLVAPGMASIALDFGITGGSVQSHLGARADVTGFVHDVPFFGPWNFCIYCANYSLDTNITLSGTPLGSQRTGTDSFGVAGVGPDLSVFGATVAQAQVTLNVHQTARFTPQSVFGNLVYTHQETGTTRSAPFSILSGVSVLDADLDLPGTWDFSISGLDVASVFDTGIGAGLTMVVDLIGVVKGNWPFANLNLLDTASFGLDFGSHDLPSAFSILVVPEPGILVLLGFGIAGLAAQARPRDRSHCVRG